jgi:DNA-binding response OmpR family regulator
VNFLENFVLATSVRRLRFYRQDTPLTTVSTGRESQAVVSYRVLLVDTDPETTATLEQVLASAGYRVAAVNTFENATRQLALDCPDLVVTTIRLGQFNGLHLVLRCRSDAPNMPVIVIGGPEDVGLSAEAVRYGARFITKPLDPGAFVALVTELLTGQVPRDPLSTRRWPRKTAELPATVAHSPARVIDLSYGGLRLEFDGEPDAVDDDQVHVDLPTLGVSFKAVPRWTRPTTAGQSWWCGVELSALDQRAVREWRVVVDSVN